MNNKIDLSFLNKGVYIIKIKTDSTNESIKFIKN